MKNNSDSGYIYNVDPILASTITIEYVDKATSYYTPDVNIEVYVGTSAGDCTIKVEPTLVGTTYTFDISGYNYFKIVNAGSNAVYLNFIKIA